MHSSNRRGTGIVACLALGVGVLAFGWAASGGTQTVPYLQTFETFTGAQSGEFVTGLEANPSVACSNVTITAGGTRSVNLKQAALTLGLSGANRALVWCKMYVKPVAFETTPDLSLVTNTDSAAFCVTTNGALWALNRNTWSNLNYTVNTNLWTGFGAQLDYNALKWDLYASTAQNVTGTMNRINSRQLTMCTSPGRTPTAIGFVIVSNNAAVYTYVDNLEVRKATSNLVTVGETPVTFTETIPAGPFTNQAVALAVEYVAGHNSLSGDAGQHLGSGLSVNDRLRWYDNSGPGWQTYQWNGVAWTVYGGTSVDPSDAHILGCNPVFLTRMGSSAGRVWYAAASNVVAALVSQPQFGGSNLSHRGWNLDKRAAAAGRLLNSGGLGLAFANVVGDATQGHSYIFRFYSNPVNRWEYDTLRDNWMNYRTGQADVGTSIGSGAAYWIRRMRNGYSATATDN
jgi:hypothetical protein